MIQSRDKVYRNDNSGFTPSLSATSCDSCRDFGSPRFPADETRPVRFGLALPSPHKMDDFQPITVLQFASAPVSSRHDLTIQFHRDSVALHA